MRFMVVAGCLLLVAVVPRGADANEVDATPSGLRQDIASSRANFAEGVALYNKARSRFENSLRLAREAKVKLDTTCSGAGRGSPACTKATEDYAAKAKAAIADEAHVHALWDTIKQRRVEVNNSVLEALKWAATNCGTYQDARKCFDGDTDLDELDAVLVRREHRRENRVMRRKDTGSTWQAPPEEGKSGGGAQCTEANYPCRKR